MLCHLSSGFLTEYPCSPGVFYLLFLSAFQWFKLCDFLSVYFGNEMHLSKASHRNAAMNIWMQTAQPVGKAFHSLPMRSKLRLRGRGRLVQRYIRFFFPANLFYKGVLWGLPMLLIPRSSLSVKRCHILTVIVNYFEKILWKVLFLCYYKLGQVWFSKVGWPACCVLGTWLIGPYNQNPSHIFAWPRGDRDRCSLISG